MDWRKNWMQAAALALCAVLLCVVIRQGRQAAELQLWVAEAELLAENLTAELGGAKERLAAAEAELAARQPLVQSFQAACVDIDIPVKTLTVRVYVQLALEEEIQRVEITARPAGTGLEGWASEAWRNEEGVYIAHFWLPLETAWNLEFTVNLYENGELIRSEELGRVNSMAELLPVRMKRCEFSTHYDNDLGLFSWTGCDFQFEDGSEEPADLTLHVYRNDRLVSENPVQYASAGEYWGEYREGDPTAQAACGAGDRIEFRFACKDSYGLQYEFPAGWWEIGAYRALRHLPLSAWPTVAWPE